MSPHVPGDMHALVIEGVSKAYPGANALSDLTLHIPKGTIHGLVGENGAGKSTAMKCVAGAIDPDSGTITVNGTVCAGDIRDAADAGVAMIYQELTIVPELSVVDNVLLGALPERLGIVDRREARRRYRAAADLVRLNIPSSAKAGSLSTSAQQLLEVARALASGRDLLIMDEPTASLGPEDTDRLHTIMATLRDAGVTIIYISHDLDAVLHICDNVTVMREGAAVRTLPANEWTKPALIEAMIGSVPLDSAGATRSATRLEPIMTIDGLYAPGVAVDHLQIRSGEILGIAGLVGSGRTRLLRAIAGADPIDAGALTVDGLRVRWPGSPRAARAHGILLAPEDRKLQGLVLDRQSGWNVTLGQFGKAGPGKPVTRARLQAWARRYTDQVGFAATRLAAPARTLSGGNQQKLILARLLGNRTRCLLLDEPTRGIDVGAKAQIFDTIRSLVNDGHAVIWSSSDLHEVAQHSDRILVVANGRVVAELPRGAAVRDILDHAFASTRKASA